MRPLAEPPAIGVALLLSVGALALGTLLVEPAPAPRPAPRAEVVAAACTAVVPQPSPVELGEAGPGAEEIGWRSVCAGRLMRAAIAGRLGAAEVSLVGGPAGGAGVLLRIAGEHQVAGIGGPQSEPRPAADHYPQWHDFNRCPNGRAADAVSLFRDQGRWSAFLATDSADADRRAAFVAALRPALDACLADAAVYSGK